MLLASAAGGADDETAVFCATEMGEREIDPRRKRNIKKQRGKQRVMSSLYRDKNNFAKPTAAHDFSRELGDWLPSGWMVADPKVIAHTSACRK
jgi:hypothetical protein